jgi:aryl-alcohol dehydrogenase-like predicted oxidoreductase
MQRRRLGNSGLEVAPLAFGGNVFGWTVDEKTGFELLDAFVSNGFNLIDTADVYPKWVPGNQGGESEAIIGNWLRRSGRRQDVVIATKVGMEMAPDRKGLSKEHILHSAEESLRRLQTDHIDLYQSHRDDAETPLEETLAAYDQLIKEGKVRAIGASNYSTARLEEALNVSKRLGLPRYESLQPLYNLYDRGVFERELEPLCERENIGVIPYYSLAAGFLSGKYRSEADLAQRARGDSVKKYLNERGLGILEALDEVAAKYSSTPARVALAWLIARPSITAPIASATSLAQLNDLIEATRLDLDHESIEMLNRASAEQSADEKSYARTQSS